MNDIMTIAQSTFYRVARMKALYLILLICVLDVAAMSAYKELSLGMEEQLMIDCALALALVAGLVSAMIAAFEVPRELREKTAQFILSKPMGRSAFIWGKFLGVSALCVFNIAFVAVGSLVAYQMVFGEVAWGLAYGAILVAVEAVVLTGVGLFLSIFLADTMAAIGVFAVFVIGHALPVLVRSVPAAELVTYVLPNFHHLDIKTEVSHGLEVATSFVGMGVLYGLAYALAITALAVILFNRKDIS